VSRKPSASVPATVVDLVERFERDRKVFLSADYKEEQLRKANTPREQEYLKRTIAATDNQIDALVTEIPGRSDKGDLFVEGGSR
jgi:hypothetical protein